MKLFLKPILKYYLKYIAKIALLIHRPTIIAVAGSINKSFAKEIIEKKLTDAKFNVRANPNNFNTEIGLPLSILSLSSGYNSFSDWLPVILKAPSAIFKALPKFLVLSLGTSGPGDMGFLLSIIKPKYVVVTDISQRYIEGFHDMDNIQAEYIELTKKIPKDGILIYNNDNLRVKTLKTVCMGKTIGFGYANDSDYQIINSSKSNTGQNMEYFNDKKQRLTKDISCFGQHHLYNQLISEIINDYVIPGQA